MPTSLYRCAVFSAVLRHQTHIVFFALLCAFSFPASAQPVETVEENTNLWKWRNANAVDFTLIGASLATAITSRILGPAEGRWGGRGILADEAVRDALVLSTRSKQRTIAGLSDLSLSLVSAMPMIDAFVLAYGYYGEENAGRQIAILNGEVVFFLAAIQTVTNSIAGRERPYGRRCGNDLPANLDECVSKDRNFSFFSGHASQAFAAAALTCSHHANIKLYGGGAAEVVQCVGAFSLAAFTATARMMADKHYLSDVIAGAFFGTLTGFGLPYLLRYRKPLFPKSSLRLLPTGNGFQFGGDF